jgi:hypothetical protein
MRQIGRGLEKKMGGSGAIDDFETRVESRERISWTSIMVGGRQDENDSGEMLRRATWRNKGECMDRIGGDSSPFEDLLAREKIDR